MVTITVPIPRAMSRATRGQVRDRPADIWDPSADADEVLDDF
jgi:hypothetical protein